MGMPRGFIFDPIRNTIKAIEATIASIQAALSTKLPIVVLEAEVQAAYEAGTPIHYGTDVDVNVTLDFSSATTDSERFAIWDAAQKWQASCSIPGEGEIVLIFPEGLTVLGTEYFLRGPNSPRLRYEAASAPTEIEITNVSAGAISSGVCEVTVTLASVLPDRVVVNYPIGMQNIRGDNDAQSFNGGLRVKTIAGDRLSFTADMFFYTQPINPTTLTAGTDNSVTRNRAIIPLAAIDWSGGTASNEAWCIFFNGGRGTDRWMGHVYTGTSADGTFFYLGEGAVWDSSDTSVYVGGPERIFRLFNNSHHTGNRCCFGGGTSVHTAALIESQSGGKITDKRCTFGGAISRQVLVGQGVQAELAQSFFTGGSTACVENAGGYITDMAEAEIHHSVRGIYTRQIGFTQVSTTTEFTNCVTALAYFEGGRVLGSPVFGTGVINQASSLPNVAYRGGWWLQSSLVDLIYSELNISGSNPTLLFTDGLSSSRIRGDGGNIYLETYTTARDMWGGTQANPNIFHWDMSEQQFNTPKLRVGASGSSVTQIKHYSQSLDAVSVAANTTAEQTFTVTGLTTDDFVTVNPGATLEAGLGIVGARVSAADTLAITYANNTGSAIDPAANTYKIRTERI